MSQRRRCRSAVPIAAAPRSQSRRGPRDPRPSATSAAKAARAGLVRDRHRHLRARRERLEQSPLGAGQILEAVREDRRAAPGTEVASEAFDGFPPHAVAIAQAEPRQLVAICVDELRELALEPIAVHERRTRARRWSGAACPRSPASRRTSADPRARERPPRAGLPSRAAHPTRSPDASRSSSAIARKRSSKVPIVPARSAGRRRIRSRSTRSTSSRFGTTSHGSRSSAAT